MGEPGANYLDSSGSVHRDELQLRPSFPSESAQALTDDVEERSGTGRQDNAVFAGFAAKPRDQLARPLLELPREGRDLAPSAVRTKPRPERR
jgi:hypothetical protein